MVVESNRLKHHFVIGCFAICVGGIEKLIVVDFSLGVLVYFYFFLV